MKTYTFAIIKPDAVANRTDGQIIDRIIRAGFTVERVVLTTWSRSLAKKFYKDLQDKPFYDDLVEFMASGPSYSMILSLPEGTLHVAKNPAENAIKLWRNIIGATDPKKALDGTIRSQFGALEAAAPMMHNAVHGSDSLSSVLREIELMRGLDSELLLHHLSAEWYSVAEDSVKLAE